MAAVARPADVGELPVTSYARHEPTTGRLQKLLDDVEKITREQEEAAAAAAVNAQQTLKFPPIPPAGRPSHGYLRSTHSARRRREEVKSFTVATSYVPDRIKAVRDMASDAFVEWQGVCHRIARERAAEAAQRRIRAAVERSERMVPSAPQSPTERCRRHVEARLRVDNERHNQTLEELRRTLDRQHQASLRRQGALSDEELRLRGWLTVVVQTVAGTRLPVLLRSGREQKAREEELARFYGSKWKECARQRSRERREKLALMLLTRNFRRAIFNRRLKAKHSSAGLIAALLRNIAKANRAGRAIHHYRHCIVAAQRWWRSINLSHACWFQALARQVAKAEAPPPTAHRRMSIQPTRGSSRGPGRRSSRESSRGGRRRSFVSPRRESRRRSSIRPVEPFPVAANVPAYANWGTVQCAKMYNSAVKFDATPHTSFPDRNTLLAVLIVRVIRKKSLECLRLHRLYGSKVDAYLEKKRYIQRVSNFSKAGEGAGKARFAFVAPTTHSRQGWARQQRSQRERVRLFEEGVKLGLELIFAKEHRLELPTRLWGRRLMDRREMVAFQQELSKLPVDPPVPVRRAVSTRSLKRGDDDTSSLKRAGTMNSLKQGESQDMAVRRMTPVPAPLHDVGSVDYADISPQITTQTMSSTKRKARKKNRVDIVDSSRQNTSNAPGQDWPTPKKPGQAGA
eukprot:Hpha_TRINITY_DN4907_c0_g1::TRINITY_DN4907_c0_g1_i1::g.51426::m.51426